MAGGYIKERKAIISTGLGYHKGSYIARKFDKWGKRFGFVSFSDIGDAKRLVGEMTNLWLGSYKLFVALARFVDGVAVGNPVDDTKGKGKVNENVSHANPNTGGAQHGTDKHGVDNANAVVGGGRSFLDSVLNRNKGDVIRIEDNIEGFFQWYGCYLLGKVVDFKALTNLKVVFRNRGWSSVEIKYLTGFYVMLVFKSMEETERFWLDKELWTDVFASIDRWDGKQKLMDERIAWLQVHGVPLQLAIDQVFDLVGAQYGEVVQPARMSTDDRNFSYAYIGILCKSSGRIVDRVDISWRGDTFNVWIDEDVGEWVPDCVEEFDYVSEVMAQDNVVDRVVEPISNDAREDVLEMGEIRGDDGTGVEASFNIGVDSGLDGNTDANVKVGTSLARKKFRRKALFKNKGEVTGSYKRPKKRQRDDNDMFGLDKLIGIVAPPSDHSFCGIRDSDEGLCTPDLNKRYDMGRENVEDEVDQEGREPNVVTNVFVGSENGIDASDPLMKEVEDTVTLGRALGVSDLNDFAPKVHEILRSEGFQEGGQ
ncbi:hypothetical protein L1987_12338 [Smallanthus sonchifolius]|uniref:Uncharacterized protein n=1 Tax=Smallanthus sonchifolius TaxID=185202 RepID=A0ACB9JDI2_9ASTR|nr:hypothetical protein L1987_12338 [Smallanthus sonchifolius]